MRASLVFDEDDDFEEIGVADTVDNKFKDDDSDDVIKKIFEKFKNKKEIGHIRGRGVRGSFNGRT